MPKTQAKTRRSPTPAAAKKPPARATDRRAVAESGAESEAVVPARSEGQRQFRAVPGSLARIAEQIGVLKQSVAEWKRGDKVPQMAARAAIQDVYGIESAAWGYLPEGHEVYGPEDDDPAPRRSPTRVRRDADSASCPSTLEDTLALLAAYRSKIADPRVLPSDLIKLGSAMNSATATRVKIEAEASLLEDRIVREHPAWRRIEAAILAAVKPYPKASAAVLAALDVLR